jgi:hypothetical protein
MFRKASPSITLIALSESMMDLTHISMFGNVFTAMESLIYLYHGEESCDIHFLHNFTFEAFTNISIKTGIFDICICP